MPSGTLFFLEKAGKELLSRALRPTPQNVGAKSEPAARADSLCRPVRCSFLKKQAKNFSFALWSGGLRRACTKGRRTSAAQCLCSRIALWSGELALTLVQEAGARARRRRVKVSSTFSKVVGFGATPQGLMCLPKTQEGRKTSDGSFS